ncbi:MAG: dihydropyrimidinase [Spirochaetaceae bacterium 4572_59]|nr:MAG: dihydropyrimidinase [Spirochaetaceae bacterium 4572_59]
MKFDMVIKNGRIITSTESYYADIGISGEKIGAIGLDLDGSKIIDATGKLVTPGAVDTHVHLEMPIGEYVSTDDFYTGTRAAAFGGTTTFIDFVESKKDQSFSDALKERNGKAEAISVIDYSFHMTIGPDDMGKLNQVPAAVNAGCRSFKLYMAYGLKLNDGQLLKAIDAVNKAGALPVVHAENWDIITTLIDQNIAKGNSSPRWHPRSRPAELEGEAVERVISIASYLQSPIHILHISCPEAIQRVEDAKERGISVSAETCPQYLFLNWDVFEKKGLDGALPICSPPIRSQESQDGLWDYLSGGCFDTISTDHCPFTMSEKEFGMAAFNTIPGGVPSIEMRFPALYSKGVREGYITENQWVDLCCTSPARLFGMESKGDILVGKDADLVIFDPEKINPLSCETLHEKVDWTPYEGIDIIGWPELTISRGDILVDKGEFKAKPGRGKFL